jgi:hypothetical protein
VGLHVLQNAALFEQGANTGVPSAPCNSVNHGTLICADCPARYSKAQHSPGLVLGMVPR